MKKKFVLPDKQGHFGQFGGKYVPETLMAALEDLEKEYLKAKKDPAFKKELKYYFEEYVGPAHHRFIMPSSSQKNLAVRLRFILNAKTSTTPARIKLTIQSARHLFAKDLAKNA